VKVTPSVVFRVDESSAIGFGHMARCLALAEALLSANAEVSFWCCSVRPTTRAVLKQRGITLVDILTDESFFESSWCDTVVVVDGYQFDELFWHRLIETRPLRTVCIDDFQNITYLADIVVCYNEGVEAQQFKLSEHSLLFLGGRYLLLRAEVLAAANLLTHIGSRRAVIVAAGGTKQTDWVTDMLAHLSHLVPGVPLWVLSARRLPATRVLSNAGALTSQVRFFSGLGVAAMIKRYRQARCVIVPASTMMLEAFAVGCPIVSGWIADNQRNSLDFYHKEGMIVNVGELHHQSRKGLAQALAKVGRRSRSMRRRQRTYIENSKQGILKLCSAILATAKKEKNEHPN
jgi:UDP-2,4-diacetamido-2,4,6-trideoxy-beta-L-altropyranose hydrolase